MRGGTNSLTPGSLGSFIPGLVWGKVSFLAKAEEALSRPVRNGSSPGQPSYSIQHIVQCMVHTRLCGNMDNTDLSCSRTLDPDMTNNSNLGHDVTTAPGGSAGLSDPYGLRTSPSSSEVPKLQHGLS